jgi:hypothetical protein
MEWRVYERDILNGQKGKKEKSELVNLKAVFWWI